MKFDKIPDEFFRECLDVYGVWPQLRQAQEEAAELILAINHFDRGKCDERTMMKEVIDNLIMLKQIIILFPDLYEECVDEKFEKAKNYLDKYKKKCVKKP